MKNKLLALTLALLMLVTAIPAGAIGMVGVESADEVGTIAETAEAEVMANTTGEYKPGINFLSGSEYAETFNGYTATTEYGTQRFPSNSESIINSNKDIRVTSDGEGNQYAEISFSSSDTNARISADAKDTNFGRPAYFYVMAKHVAGGTSQLTLRNASLMGSNPGNKNTLFDSKINPVNTSNDGWLSYELNASSPEIAFGYDEWNNPQAGVFFAKYEQSNAVSSGKAAIYFDNLVLVPYYKITYKNTTTGTDTVKYFLGTEKLSVDTATGKILGLPTAYPVDLSITLPISNGYAFKGWATTENAEEPMTSIPLNNQDITLYPVWGQATNYTFVAAEGDYVFYSVYANPAALILPTAEEMGVAYQPMFSDGEKIYYPGQRYTGSSTSFEVFNSHVIYAESFDDEITSDTAINMTFDYKNWTADIVTLNHRVAEYNGGKAAYRNITAAGWGANAFVSSGNFAKEGIYTIKLDLAVVPGEGGTVPTTDFFIETENLSSFSGSDKYLAQYTLNNDNRTKAVELSFELYKNADNRWEAKMLSGGREGQTRTWTWTPDSIRTCFNVHSTPSAGMTFYYDNFTVEYVPYAPTAVDKVTCRDTAPLGIRFASYVADSTRNIASNYGYIAAIKNSVSSNDLLTLDGVNVITDGMTFSGINDNGIKLIGAVAYNGADVDKIFANNGSAFGNEYRCVYETFFTGVLVNIPEDEKNTVFVARPFLKIGDTYYYGECYESSYADIMNGSDSDADLGELWK